MGDVRRRVEHEVTFEGAERRIKYVFLHFFRCSQFSRNDSSTSQFPLITAPADPRDRPPRANTRWLSL